MSSTTKPWTVRARRAPILVRAMDATLRSLNRVGVFDSRLRLEALLEEAQEKSSLREWGGISFREPLSLLLQDMQTLPLTAFGRFAARETFLQALTNRLEFVDASSHLPDESPALEQPIFVLGLHRTGTTWLQELLAADPKNRTFRFFELVRPARPDRQRARVALFANRRLSPEMKFVHPIQVESPEECWALFMSTFAVVNYALHFDIPNYERWLLSANLSYAYEEYRTQLRLLLGSSNDQRVVLKCPEHLWCLRDLFSVFPRARIVWLHRDPLRSIASYSSLSALNRRALMGEVDFESVGPDIARKFANGVHRAMSARENASSLQFCDVTYAELRRDPLRTVERIYARFELPFSAEARSGMQALAMREKAPPHVYSASQYGVNESEVRTQFAEYVNAYAVPLE